jgi:hypothetical protein
MYQTIHEVVAVAGVYTQAKFTPKKFQWRTKSYQVDQITLSSNIKDGGVRFRTYSVMSGGNLYRLLFNRDDETWLLEEVWCE